MKVKALIGAVMSAALLCAAPAAQTVAAAAEPYGIVSPLYDIAREAWADLQISGSTANCTSYANGDDAVKITGEMTLQKQGLFWTWSKVKDASWTKTVYSNAISMSNTKSDLSSGTYRVKAVFTLTDANGKSETITVYSNER